MAYAFVNAANYSSNSSSVNTSGVITLAVTAGNVLVFTVATNDTSAVPVNGITDQATNPLTYSTVQGAVSGTNFSMATYVVAGANVGSGITGVIVNFSTSSFTMAVNVAQYSGISGNIDGVAGNTATATTAANGIVFPSISNTNQPAMFYAVSFDDTTYAAGPTAGTGFTTHGASGHLPEPNDSGNNPGNIQDKRLTTTGSQTATMTNAATGGDLFLMISFAWDEAASGPPPIAPYGPMPKQIYIMP